MSISTSSAVGMPHMPRMWFRQVVAAAITFVSFMPAIVGASDTRTIRSAAARTPLAVSATGNDADAGMWQMIVLTGPTQIAVAAPGQVGGPDYQAELTSIRNAQAQITADQRKAIEHLIATGRLVARSRSGQTFYQEPEEAER